MKENEIHPDYYKLIDIDIDFPIPLLVKNTMEDTENALKEDGELGPFLNWVETLDNVCKEAYVTGLLTKKQWEYIMSRYDNFM